MATSYIQFDPSKVVLPDIREFQIATAREALKEASGASPDAEVTWRAIVDGRFNAPIESVKPYGRIELVRRDLGEVVEWVWAELLRRSPVLTGRYQDSHILKINGQPVESIKDVQPGDKIQFINIQPYSRKIEGGHGINAPDFTPQSPKAPNGVYRAVWKAARRKFGKSAFIDFRWTQEGGGHRVMHRARKGSRKYVEGNMIYPMIQIRMLGLYDS